MTDLRVIIRAFACSGRFLRAESFGSGHINDSYVVTVEEAKVPRRYLLQRINHHVFPDTLAVMENLRRVTAHVAGRLAAEGATDLPRRTLALVPTREGDVFHRDALGNTWRVFPFIEDAHTIDVVKTPAQAAAGARAFGRFQRHLLDLPGPRLTETIPGFHDTPARFAALFAAVARDRVGRAREAGAEIAFAREREGFCPILLDAFAAGAMPERVIHNDTKMNNVLLDDGTGEGICVIDLDTVMPGLSLYDFGDLVRGAMSRAAAEERDLGKVVFRPEIYEALAEGYTAEMGDFLTPAEVEFMPISGRLIAFELGMRFLTDHLQGDTYFRVHRSAQNLDRARAQFELVRKMEDLPA
jgi:Ser/Thr protein kinase RdoA (MazF antagonist)